MVASLPILLLTAVGAGYFWGTRDASGVRQAEPARESDSPRDATRERIVRTVVSEWAKSDAPPSGPVSPDGLGAAEPSVSPEKARERHVARVRASGPDTQNLLLEARRVGQGWIEALKAKHLDARFGEWECHRGGCLVNVGHGSPGAVDPATDEITRTDGFHAWNGEKMRSGPVQAGNTTEVTWILFAPREGEPAIQPTETGANQAAPQR